jgi:hypothetical protein
MEGEDEEDEDEDEEDEDVEEEDFKRMRRQGGGFHLRKIPP